MKRLLGLMVAMLMALCGCSANDGMRIEPAQLTSKEAKIAALMGADVAASIFDFCVGQDVKSMSVRVYRAEDGAWEPYGGGSFAMDAAEGRIFLDFGRLSEGLRVAVQAGEDSFSSAREIPADTALDGMACLTSWGGGEPVVYGKEIPLVVQVFDRGSGIESLGTAAFGEPEKFAGYDAAFAVTVAFSTEELE